MNRENHDLAFIALASVPGIGPARLRSLLGRFGTAEHVLGARHRALTSTPGVSVAAATAIASASVDAARRSVERTIELGGTVLTWSSALYPALLRQISDPPPILYCLGNLDLRDSPCVAVVGSREHTRYGEDVCRRIVRLLAESGITIVSGMARGIDAVAHAAALDAAGATIGVLGNGLGVVYPAANRALYSSVATSGLLISEFPPGERPTAGSFPRRNRLISGLSKVVWIVEANTRSGALITAELALDQGREVCALPGPITSQTSEGTNKLIAAGAKPVLGAEDILEEFSLAPRASQPRKKHEDPLLDLLSTGARHIDELAAMVGQTTRETLSKLTTMELDGIVTQEPGMVWRMEG